MSIAVIGAGAFGSALAITWARAGQEVILYGRDAEAMKRSEVGREVRRLPGATLPVGITCTSDLSEACQAETLMFAIPAQQLVGLLKQTHDSIANQALVACCKGIDLNTMTGPVAVLQKAFPDNPTAMLTGPSFAADLANGLPTALTLACADEVAGVALQQGLSTPNLRLYRTLDTVGAEFGGALKNVMAIACGMTMGAGLGESARAALITRGFTEMTLLAERCGAVPETLAGLSGFGDLVLTCTSNQSRNYSYGFALGRNDQFDETITVEGVATAKAVVGLASSLGLDMPIVRGVTDVIAGRANVKQTLGSFMARPLKEE